MSTGAGARTGAEVLSDKTSLGHIPRGGRWEFDASVADVFDDMLRRSIPQYAVMRDAVTALACAYARPKSEIVDLGCSRGEALAPLIDRYGAQMRYLGVELAPSMLDAANARFASYIDAGVVTIRALDLRHDYPYCEPSVVLSVLTAQFIPIEYRQRLLSQIWTSLRPNGALILVEKVLGASATLDAEMVAQYYAFKRASGYSQEEIDRKRLSLEGVLVPLTAQQNVDLLRQTGFRDVDCFWRWMNFAGWIAVK